MRRILIPLIFGFGGFAILAGLGAWQLQRLAWKESILAEMNALLADEPRTLTQATDPMYVRFAPIRMSGRTTGDEVHVLQSTGQGAGYRLISAFEAEDGQRILLDEGFIASAEKDAARAPRDLTVLGNLHWPDDTDSYTPAPDREKNIWYGRDVVAISEALQTQPVFVVLREVEVGEAVAVPLPLDTSGIPNNHLGYAVQWFGLAAVWLGMTLYLLWRTRSRTD